MNFRHKKREQLDITLISMIDVLFVLLLFFMVSTTFNRHTEVKVKLPEADAQAEQHPKLINLTIDAAGRLFFNENRWFCTAPGGSAIGNVKKSAINISGLFK